MGYVPALDGIRAVAILAVVLVHSRLPFAGGGWAGVDVFFVLSGFLITRILAEEHSGTGGIDVGRFYLRRLRRLYPALLLFLTAYLLSGPWIFPHFDAWIRFESAAISALYLSDYARDMGIQSAGLGHLWSLSVEEHFYLLWPLALIVILKLPPRRGRSWIAGMYLLATAWRIGAHALEVQHPYFRFDTHASGLLLGCLLGLSNLRLQEKWGWLGLAGIAACVVGGYESRYAMTMVEIFAAMLVAGRPSQLGALAWFGRMSYGWYLWHSPMMSWTRMNVGVEPWQQLLIGGIGGLVIATLSYYTVEAAFRRRKLVPNCDGPLLTIPMVIARDEKVPTL